MKNAAPLSKDAKRKLLEQMLEGKPIAVPRQESPCFQIPQEYIALSDQFKHLEEQGFGKIYFNISQGVNNNFTAIDDREFINYSGYNYLNLSGNPVVSQAAKEAIDRYGTSVSASRIASGERPLHQALEKELADFLGTAACVVFVSGFGTNENVIGHLLEPGDLILYDSLIHSSIQEGAKQSGAGIKTFPHNNFNALDVILQQQRRQYRYALIVLEGVYSMDGDIPDLPRFIEVKKRHNAMLMVDEAHSIGVLGKHGRGIGEYHGVDPADVDLWMGTLSKSFASCGGYIAGSEKLIEYLRHTAPGFVYSVGMTPPNTAAALAALRLLKKEPERVTTLGQRSSLFLNLAREYGLNTGTSRDSAVIPVILGQSMPCIRLYKHLYDNRIMALPIVYPAVPENAARLRFFLSCAHTEEQIRTTISVISEFLNKAS